MFSKIFAVSAILAVALSASPAAAQRVSMTSPAPSLRHALTPFYPLSSNCFKLLDTTMLDVWKLIYVLHLFQLYMKENRAEYLYCNEATWIPL
jgi:hypothetical protein